jgi:shikimate kinase
MRASDPPPGERIPARNLLLVGFMGAGKTTVGRVLASSIGWRFIDIDEEIVRRAGMSIADLFRTSGETAFRAMESELTAGLSSVDRTVIAPGGGWIAAPENIERLPPMTCTVWLRVPVEEAVRRVRAAGIRRPLLSGPGDPVVAARKLLDRREPLYGQADLVVDTAHRTPEEIAREIRSRIRLEG